MDAKIANYIIFDDSDIQPGLKGCEKSIIGKFYMEKPINKGALEAVLKNIWGHPKGLRIEEIKPKLF